MHNPESPIGEHESILIESLTLEVPDDCISGLLCVLVAEKRILAPGEVQSFPERQGCWYLFAMQSGSLQMTHESSRINLHSGNAAIISGNSVTSIWPSEGGTLLVYCFQGIVPDEIIQESRKRGGLFYSKGAAIAREIYGQLLAALRTDRSISMTKASQAVYTLLMQLYGTGKAYFEEKRQIPKVVEDALRIFQKDFAFLYGVAEVADRLEVSQEYLTRSFRKSVGITPGKYLNQLKIEYAKMLFRQGGHTVSFVADACGFANCNYFARVFREATGITPSEYMKTHTQSSIEDPMLDPFYVL